MTKLSSPIVAADALPVLDLREFNSGDAAARQGFVLALRDTVHRLGFLSLTGHGAGEALEAGVLKAARDFFALLASDKAALHMIHSPHFRGYTAAGGEITRGERDWREQFDIGSERPVLVGAASDTFEPWRRLQGPNLWPEALPGFQRALLDWQDALTSIGTTLLRALALALGQPEGAFDAAFEPDAVQHLKIIQYPGRAAREANQGVGPHKDSGFLTLLLQDREPGLQVQVGEGWIDVPPRPGTLVVNIGEALEILSGGFVTANVHRVVSPPAGSNRLSVAFFLGPRIDAELPPFVLPPDLSARARGVALDPLNPLIAHAGKNFLKGRLRSHPDVARRHYADVLAE
jgi:isopenicillin N synthase-like dioxygenase